MDHLIDAQRAMKEWTMRFVKCLILFALACAVVALAGCGSVATVVGIESTAQSNDRQAEMTKYVNEKAEVERKLVDAKLLAFAEVMDMALPGTKKFVRDTLAGVPSPDAPKAPEPKADGSDSFPPWANTVAEIGTAVVLSYFGINATRNAKRRKFGEATNVEEAKALGQVDALGRPIPVTKVT